MVYNLQIKTIQPKIGSWLTARTCETSNRKILQDILKTLERMNYRQNNKVPPGIRRLRSNEIYLII